MPHTADQYQHAGRRGQAGSRPPAVANQWEGCGFECLIDRHGISGGEDWKRHLGNLISEADTGRLRALAEFGKLPNLRLGGGGSKTPQQTAMSAIAPLRSVQINDKNQRMEH